MTFLEQFSEPIKIAGKSIGDKYRAYKMDSTYYSKDMRKTVGLGTCHCCDYFLPKDGSVILIEETRLLKRVNNIRKKYSYLNDKDKDDAVRNCILTRMQLKAYGAMLVLCRLAIKYSSAKDLVQDKKYHFWLVVSSIESEEEKRYFDNLKDSLRGKLKDVLGTKLLDGVDVLSSEYLKDRLPHNYRLP